MATSKLNNLNLDYINDIALHSDLPENEDEHFFSILPYGFKMNFDTEGWVISRIDNILILNLI